MATVAIDYLVGIGHVAVPSPLILEVCCFSSTNTRCLADLSLWNTGLQGSCKCLSIQWSKRDFRALSISTCHLNLSIDHCWEMLTRDDSQLWAENQECRRHLQVNSPPEYNQLGPLSWLLEHSCGCFTQALVRLLFCTFPIPNKTDTGTPASCNTASKNPFLLIGSGAEVLN